MKILFVGTEFEITLVPELIYHVSYFAQDTWCLVRFFISTTKSLQVLQGYLFPREILISGAVACPCDGIFFDRNSYLSTPLHALGLGDLNTQRFS